MSVPGPTEFMLTVSSLGVVFLTSVFEASLSAVLYFYSRFGKDAYPDVISYLLLSTSKISTI